MGSFSPGVEAWPELATCANLDPPLFTVNMVDSAPEQP